MEPSRRRPLFAIGLALAGAAAALGVAEVALRLAGDRIPGLRALLYSPTERTQYDRFETAEELLAASSFGHHPLGRTPGFVLNSRGFRSAEIPFEKPPGTFRVVALGDSFTFDSSGVPFDWMWHQVLGRRLAAATGRPVEVLSLGVPAVGPRFELRLWELEGRRYDPDLVVMAFFVGNDFVDESGVPLEPTAGEGLARRSLAFRALRNALRVRRAAVQAPEAAAGGGGVPEAGTAAPAGAASAGRPGGRELPGYAATYDPHRPGFDEPAFLAIEARRIRSVCGDDPLFERRLGEAAAVIERLARSVELTGAGFVVMVIPDQAQVDRDLQGRLGRSFPDLASGLDLDRPQRRLGEVLAARGVAVLDLAPRFRRAGGGTAAWRGEPLYKLRDTHWSAAGNRLAGRTVAEFVLGHGGLFQPPAPRE